MEYAEQIIYTIIFGVGCYLIGYFINFQKTNRLSNFFFRYSIYITITIFLIGIFAPLENDIKQAAITFSSVYLGFWLGDAQKKKDEVKKLHYYLGLLLEETRFNIFIYEQIIINSTFLFTDVRLIPINAAKVGSLYSLSGRLKNVAHGAYTSSGAMAALSIVNRPTKEKDHLFNVIEISYNNIDYFKTYLLTVTIDFRNKAEGMSAIVGSPYEEGIINDMKAKVQSATKELKIAQRSSIKAQKVINDFLKNYRISHDTSELRESLLTETDKQYLREVIRSETRSPSDVFRTPEL